MESIIINWYYWAINWGGKKNKWAIGFIIIIIFQIIVNGSYAWSSGGFGSRRFCSVLPLLSFGLVIY